MIDALFNGALIGIGLMFLVHIFGAWEQKEADRYFESLKLDEDESKEKPED